MFNENPLTMTLKDLISKRINTIHSQCMLTGSQCEILMRHSREQLPNLEAYIKQNHNYDGKIHYAKVEEIVKAFLESLITKLQQAQSSQSFNINQGFNAPSNPVVSFLNDQSQSGGAFLDSFTKSTIVAPQPKAKPQKEVVELNGTAYSENNVNDNPLEKTNDVDGKHLAKHGMPGIIDIQNIREYRNKINNSKYRFINAVYNIPEESDSEVVRNFVKSLPDLTNHNKYMVNIRYPRFKLLKNVEYDSILSDYESVKKISQSKNFFEAIKALNNKAFNFSSEMKKMIVYDINDMLERYVRTNTDIDTIIKIDEVEEIQELMCCNKSLGVDAFMMDDFDGFILSIVSEVFTKYFGKESTMYRIDKDMNHILSHSEVIIRTPDFTDRDYYSLTKDQQVEFEKEMKQYAVFGFMSNCILTNVFPDSIKELLNIHESYMVNNPGNSFESMIFENLHKQIKNYSVKAFSANEHLGLRIGRTIEGDLLLLKM